MSYNLLRRKRSIWKSLTLLSTKEDNKAIFKDGRVAIGFQIWGHETEQATAEELAAHNTLLAKLMGNLPIGSVLQKLDVYNRKEIEEARPHNGYFAQKAWEQYYHQPIMEHRCYLFLSLGPKGQPKANAFNTFFSLVRSLIKNPFKNLIARMGQTEQLGLEIIHALAGSGIRYQRLKEEELDQLYLRYYNLAFNQAEAPTHFHSSLTPEINGLGVGSQYLNVVSAIGQGGFVDHSLFNSHGLEDVYPHPLGLGLNVPHIVSTSLRLEDREKELKRFDMQKRINSSLDFLASQSHRIQAADIDAWTEKIRTQNLPLVSMNLSVLLWDRDSHQLQRNIERTVASFRQMGGMECFIEGKDTTSLFMANAPGNSFQSYRYILMDATNASVYMPFSTVYQGDKSGIRLADRYRRPLWVRLFHSDSNSNALVIGPSGSGKSFTVGSFIIQRHEQGHRQIILDVGGTYKNTLTAIADSKYFSISPETPLQFNPFLVPQSPTGEYLLSSEKLLFLTTLLALLWKGEQGISQTEAAIFSEILPAFFSQHDPETVPTLEWFYLYIQSIAKEADWQESWQHFDLSSLLINLKPFVEGEYQDIFASEETLALSSHKLIAFDLAGVQSNPLLAPVLALILAELTMEQMRTFPDSQKYFYADEAWSFLSGNKQMEVFLEYLYRTCRKHNGSISIITQSVSELIHSSAGDAIIANSHIRMILHHTDPQQIARLGDVLGFTDHELEKIHSIRVFPDRRELFLKRGDVSHIYMLEVSPAMQAVLSSKPEERNQLTTLETQKGSMNVALNQYLENKELEEKKLTERKEVHHA